MARSAVTCRLCSAVGTLAEPGGIRVGTGDKTSKHGPLVRSHRYAVALLDAVVLSRQLDLPPPRLQWLAAAYGVE